MSPPSLQSSCACNGFGRAVAHFFHNSKRNGNHAAVENSARAWTFTNKEQVGEALEFVAQQYESKTNRKITEQDAPKTDAAWSEAKDGTKQEKSNDAAGSLPKTKAELSGIHPHT